MGEDIGRHIGTYLIGVVSTLGRYLCAKAENIHLLSRGSTVGSSKLSTYQNA